MMMVPRYLRFNRWVGAVFIGVPLSLVYVNCNAEVTSETV